MRKKVTIPPAGEILNLKMNGNSFVIEDAGTYTKPSEVPVIKSVPHGEIYPAYPRAAFGSYAGYFDDLIIVGTAESAGDELYIYVTDACLETDFKVILGSNQYKTAIKATFTKAASDAVQSLSDVELVNAEGVLPSKISVWVKGGNTAGINYAFDANPSQGISATDAGYLDNEPTNKTASQDVAMFPLEISGINFIQAFNFIAAVATETPTLVIQCEY